jgi:protein TonB
MTQTAPSPQAIREIAQTPAQAPAESVATRETRQVVQETPVSAASVESATTSTTAQIVAKATSVEPVAPPRLLPDAAPPASVVQEPKLQEVPVQSAPAVEQSSVKEVRVRAVPAPKADYGWLAQTLWSRVERFKRYPAAARANRMEGRVLLRAVIGDDGGLRSLDVLEGSGHEELDQAALEAVRRATPLQLPHELGRPQVVVQIPITYKLR